MPKIAGLNLLGLVLAALAMWIIGFLWYGLIFGGAWMDASGYTEEMFEGQSPLWMPAGFVISLLLSFGLGWHMKQKSITKTDTAALFGFWMALLIGVPLMMYGYVYSVEHSWELLLLDGGYTIVTFVAACVVLSFFD